MAVAFPLAALARLYCPVADALPSVMEQMSDENPDVRRLAIDCLARHPGPYSSVLKEVATTDANPEVREMATLRYIQSVHDVEFARSQMGNESIVVFRCARNTLIREANESTFAGLLRSPDPVVRCNAARAVGSLGTQARSLLSNVQRLIDDADQDVRREAIEAVGNIACNPMWLLPLLREELAHPLARNRQSAVWQLSDFGLAGLNALTEATTDSDVRVRAAAVDPQEDPSWGTAV